MMISSVVIFEMYAASYTAFLPVVKLALPFDSLHTMYKNTNLKIGSQRGTAYKQFVIAVSRRMTREGFMAVCLVGRPCDGPVCGREVGGCQRGGGGRTEDD